MVFDMPTNITAPAQRPDRLDSVDLLRGLVMVIMALDHVRDFFSEKVFEDPTDLTTTTSGIFLTRWITHYCAPTFIFLAGTGAFLSGTRGKSKADLAWFLFTRGLWCAFFEVTINRVFWLFSYDWHVYGAGVFWAIGWSMVVLSWLIFLPTPIVTLFGVIMIVAHNLLDDYTAQQVGLPPWVWVILHRPGEATVIDGYKFGTGYCLIPWMGVMAAGYGFGSLLLLDRGSRKLRLLHLGASLVLAFILLRTANVYGDQRPWTNQENTLRTFLSFLNCTKYPPSLLYLLMTLGPAILLMAIFDRPLGPMWRPIVTFGRVPFFFYFLHIPLIHGSAAICDYLRFGWSPLAGDGRDVPMDKVPPDFGVSLPVVYLIWIGVVLVLYLPCKWFAGVKQRHRSAWLSYF